MSEFFAAYLDLHFPETVVEEAQGKLIELGFLIKKTLDRNAFFAKTATSTVRFKQFSTGSRLYPLPTFVWNTIDSYKFFYRSSKQ